MVHGILQFTPSIAFRYVLHRCESRDIRCRESFATFRRRRSARPSAPRTGPGRRPALRFGFPWRVPRRGSLAHAARAAARRREGRRRGAVAPRPRPDAAEHTFAVCLAGLDNDPSAGSPTETLLRLLLPLNDKVQWTSRHVAGSEPPTSPRSEHFTGPFNR